MTQKLKKSFAQQLEQATSLDAYELYRRSFMNEVAPHNFGPPPSQKWDWWPKDTATTTIDTEAMERAIRILTKKKRTLKLDDYDDSIKEIIRKKVGGK